MTRIDRAHEDGDAVAGGYLAARVIGQRTIDDLDNSGSAENIDDERKVSKTSWNADGDIHEFMVSSAALPSTMSYTIK